MGPARLHCATLFFCFCIFGVPKGRGHDYRRRGGRGGEGVYLQGSKTTGREGKERHGEGAPSQRPAR